MGSVRVAVSLLNGVLARDAVVTLQTLDDTAIIIIGEFLYIIIAGPYMLQAMSAPALLLSQ